MANASEINDALSPSECQRQWPAASSEDSSSSSPSGNKRRGGREKDEQRKKKARAERERRERAADAAYAAGRAELRRRARWAEQVERILGRETGQEAAERKFEEASARRRADWW